MYCLHLLRGLFKVQLIATSCIFHFYFMGPLEGGGKANASLARTANAPLDMLHHQLTEKRVRLLPAQERSVASGM